MCLHGSNLNTHLSQKTSDHQEIQQAFKSMLKQNSAKGNKSKIQAMDMELLRLEQHRAYSGMLIEVSQFKTFVHIRFIFHDFMFCCV